MPDPLPDRPCPICHARTPRLLYQQKFDSISDSALLDGYDIVACDTCGTVHADHIPPAAKFDAYYEQMSKYEYADRGGAESPFDTGRFNSIADYLSAKISDKSIRVLDIGCGTGGLLKKLADRGFKNVTGLDPSPNCAASARKIYDLQVEVGTIDTNPLPSKSFDLLILVGVLEHIPELDKALDSILRLVADGGMVFAEVPDAGSIKWWPDAPFQQFSVEHVNFFGAQSLLNLFAQRGFALADANKPLRQFSKTTIMPSVTVLVHQQTSSTAWEKDRETEAVVKEYIDLSLAEERRIALIIKRIAESGEPIIVWGTGTHTLHLLKTTALAECNVQLYVDSNAKFQGKSLHGKPIGAPAELSHRPESILISSRVFQTDIVTQIREGLKVKNALHLLYEI